MMADIQYIHGNLYGKGCPGMGFQGTAAMDVPSKTELMNAVRSFIENTDRGEIVILFGRTHLHPKDHKNYNKKKGRKLAEERIFPTLFRVKYVQQIEPKHRKEVRLISENTENVITLSYSHKSNRVWFTGYIGKDLI